MAEQLSNNPVEFARQCGQRLVESLEAAQQDGELWSDDLRAAAAVSRAIDDCLAQLSSTGLWGKQNEIATNEFWNAAGHLLEHGELQQHARMKPRKMAGDFEMLERIGSLYECKHPVGRWFDRYFQQQAAPQAVRNRTKIVSRAIGNAVNRLGACNLVSLGSGPATEVRLAASQLDEQQRQQISATLIDLDEEALRYASDLIAREAPGVQVNTVRANLQRYADSPECKSTIGAANLVYCTGLFDYLDDAAFQSLLRSLYGAASEGARIMAFNFSENNPSRAYMEWVGAWRLIHRTPIELFHLGAAAGIPPGAAIVSAEETGVNLYIDAVKTA